jgi:hypothetical protein
MICFLKEKRVGVSENLFGGGVSNCTDRGKKRVQNREQTHYGARRPRG